MLTICFFTKIYSRKLIRTKRRRKKNTKKKKESKIQKYNMWRTSNIFRFFFRRQRSAYASFLPSSFVVYVCVCLYTHVWCRWSVPKIEMLHISTKLLSTNKFMSHINLNRLITMTTVWNMPTHDWIHENLPIQTVKDFCEFSTCNVFSLPSDDFHICFSQIFFFPFFFLFLPFLFFEQISELYTYHSRNIDERPHMTNIAYKRVVFQFDIFYLLQLVDSCFIETTYTISR